MTVRPETGRRSWPWFARRRGCDGFTLLELLFVVMIIAVLSGTAISLLSGPHAERAITEGTERVATDLAFARDDALARSVPRLVVFDEVGDAYRVCDAGGVTIAHPLAKTDYVVAFDTVVPSAVLDITDADFGGSDTLRFDRFGLPVTGGQVVIGGADGTRTVWVASETGRITVETGNAGELQPF